ncbi:MAG: ABC transporter ATP-binding protein [Planctomycetota bacterium]
MGVVASARHLELGYPGEESVCWDVNLEVESGSILALIGPNGAGKSTLLRGMAGLLSARRGEVKLNGRELGSLKVKERARQLAFLPQEMRFLEGTTVATFVAGGRYPYRRLLKAESSEDRRAIALAMAEADVAGFAECLVDELSGGQRQGVLLARALAQDADLLLVDEPTSSLDSRHQLLTFDRIRAFADAGKTAIVVTHDLNLASQYADRIGLLSKGRLVQIGVPRDILKPEVLEPIYGSDLIFGESESRAAKDLRPFVLPWRRGNST